MIGKAGKESTVALSIMLMFIFYMHLHIRHVFILFWGLEDNTPA